MIPSFKLPFTFEAEKLKSDLEALSSAKWIAHFNTRDYTGRWNGIPLRSPGGKVNSLYPDPDSIHKYRDTVFMKACPNVRQAVGSFQCDVQSVRFLRLESGAVIKTHCDNALSFEDGSVRLHIPIITNRDIEFVSDGNVLEMNEGECWYINAALPHSVANRSTTDRIHLILDCKVNEWLQGFFPFVEEVPSNGMQSIKTGKDRENMIAALKELGSPVALEIIRELEKDNG